MCLFYRFHRRYDRRYYLHRQSLSNSYSILDEFHVSDDNVAYSLNKYRRWNLVDIIRDSIGREEYEDVDSSFRLEVSYDLSRSSSTIERLSAAQTTVMDRRFINRESLEAQSKKFNSIDADIQTHFIYPCPRTYSIYYNHKYTGFRDEISYKKSRIPKNSTKREKINLKEYCKVIQEETENKFKLNRTNFSDLIDDNENSPGYLASYVYTRSDNEVTIETKHFQKMMAEVATLSPVMKQGDRKRMRLSNKQSNVVNENQCSHHQPNQDGSRLRGSDFTTSRHVKVAQKMEPALVLFPKYGVKPSFLKEQYGESYTECPSYPRKFIIDVSDKFGQRVRTSDWWRKEDASRWDLTACVTFSYVEYDRTATETLDLYHVSLNITTKNGVSKILTLYDYFKGSISDVLQRTVDSIDMLSVLEFIDKQREHQKPLTKTNFKLLNLHQNVRLESHSLSNHLSYCDIFKDDCFPQSCDIELDFSLEIDASTICGICNDRIIDVQKQTTALRACCHLFCNDCWMKYISFRLKTGYVHITCPGYNCFEVVPESILLTFINISDVALLVQRRKELSLISEKNTKWCPNTTCNRILKVKNVTKATSVMCQCGLELCFRCLQNAHWPASCASAHLYLNKLTHQTENGLFFNNLQPIKISGKKCPNCKILIDKDGPGIFISCVCGIQFCWGCSSVYPNHECTKQCFINANANKLQIKSFGAISHSRRVSDNRPSSYFKLAFNHKIARDSLKITKLIDCVRKIIIICKTIPKKKCSLYLSMFEKFELSDDIHFPTSRRKATQKISGALWEFINVYITLHYIAEYSFILLEELSQNGSQQFKLCTHIDQLSSLADKIVSFLKSSVDLKEFRPFIRRLLDLEQHCNDTIKAYVKAVSEVK